MYSLPENAAQRSKLRVRFQRLFFLSQMRIMGRERRIFVGYLRPSFVRACGVILSA